MTDEPVHLPYEFEALPPGLYQFGVLAPDGGVVPLRRRASWSKRKGKLTIEGLMVRIRRPGLPRVPEDLQIAPSQSSSFVRADGLEIVWAWQYVFGELV